MAQMTFGVFPAREAAETAINKLIDAGYTQADISVIMRDTEEAAVVEENTGVGAGEGAAKGAATGGALGLLAGLLISATAVALPGVGGLLVAGPVAAALGLTGAAATTVSTTVTGLLGGGIVGAFVGMGMPEAEAKRYQDYIEKDSIVLGVEERDGSRVSTGEVMSTSGATEVKTINTRA